MSALTDKIKWDLTKLHKQEKLINKSILLIIKDMDKVFKNADRIIQEAKGIIFNIKKAIRETKNPGKLDMLTSLINYLEGLIFAQEELKNEIMDFPNQYYGFKNKQSIK